ncbi:hypothetical protein FQN60_005446 [Etheostoma spectabile]|uniref:Sulfotransferase n=1 Tax=Etheostoma spectabile TaxID=54343 RepID=A0A5J5CI55_9PERO|nr:hypothetical protein FQN60_005446 [Etheostoma spectabile]
MALFPLLAGTSLLQEVVYLVSQGADPDEIGLMNIDEQLPVLEYPQPGLDIIQVIYMARNPKDLVVSYYQFHRSLRTMSYRGTFQEFCRRFMHDKLGYGSWFEHVQEFWEHRNDSNVLFLKYEDMYKDLGTLVENLARSLVFPVTRLSWRAWWRAATSLLSSAATRRRCPSAEVVQVCGRTSSQCL